MAVVLAPELSTIQDWEIGAAGAVSELPEPAIERPPNQYSASNDLLRALHTEQAHRRQLAPSLPLPNVAGTGSSASLRQLGAAVEDGSALLRRMGLAVWTSNTDFEEHARMEAYNAERHLAEIRQKAVLQAAQCRGHLDILAKEARAEEERRLISDLVSRELQAFRKEQHDREAKEEDHIRTMYRAMLEPQGPIGEAFSQPASESRQQVAGSRMYPPIISSTVTLQGASPAASGEGWRRAPRTEALPICSESPAFSSQPAVLDYSHRFSSSRPLEAVARSHRQKADQNRRSERPSKSTAAREPEELLNLNLARLRRLERLGL